MRLLTFVNNHDMLSNVNIARMSTFVTIAQGPMQKSVTPAIVGALVRDARTAAGLSQSELGARIGASRFWVAQFEKGKPSAELGLALKALQALGLTVRLEPRPPKETVDKRQTGRKHATSASAIPAVDLGAIIAALTVTPKGKSAIEWPSTYTRRRAAKGS
jgi:HTH-type transcriptional regulator/antitoxin HipB